MVVKKHNNDIIIIIIGKQALLFTLRSRYPNILDILKQHFLFYLLELKQQETESHRNNPYGEK